MIKVTTDNLPELKKCDKLNKTVGYPYSINGYYGSTTHGDYVVPKDYTEITLEQFQKYVLKEPIEQSKSIEKWSPGTYVVCAKEYGTHFKVGDVAQIQDGVYKINEDCVDISKSVKKSMYAF